MSNIFSKSLMKQSQGRFEIRNFESQKWVPILFTHLVEKKTVKKYEK